MYAEAPSETEIRGEISLIFSNEGKIHDSDPFNRKNSSYFKGNMDISQINRTFSLYFLNLSEINIQL